MSKRALAAQSKGDQEDRNRSEGSPKKAKLDTQSNRDREWNEMAEEFLESHWSILSNHEVTLKPSLSQVKPTPNSRVILREMEKKPEDLFFQLLSQENFQTVASILNRVMTSKKNKGMVSMEQAKRLSPVDANAMIRWYGMVMYLENSYSRRKNNVHAIIRDSSGEGILPFGENRFLAIMGCLDPSDSEFEILFSSLRSHFKLAINMISPQVVSVDESVFAYHVSKRSKAKYEGARDPVPEVTIPRKPHSHGLKVFLMTTKLSTNLAYTIDFEPYLHSDPVSPQDSIRRFLSRWPQGSPKPHIVADSAFGSIQFAEELAQQNVFVTFSIKAHDHPFLWKLMKRGIQDGQWVACGNPNGFLASTLTGDPDDPRIEEDDPSFHKLLTNAFNFNISPTTTQQHTDVPQATRGTGQTYTSEFLMAKTLTELRDIAKQEGVRVAAKSKEELAKRIQRICNPTPQQSTSQHQLISRFDSTIFTNKPPHHRFYRDNFSNVDTHNSTWYKFNYRYRLHEWRAKLLLSIFETVVINAWCLANSFRRDELLSFRERLATALMRFGLESK